MRISEYFKLNKSQFELDFIDIDPTMDIPLFLDPYFISYRTDPFSLSANRTIKSFFSHLLHLLKSSELKLAKEMFLNLCEPNETCLGLSVGIPKGRGVGPMDSGKIFDSITGSKAIKTGLVEDLEDCRIFVDGIDKDKLSDMVTNIIRHHLIEYTINQCDLWNIPLQEGVPSGFIWDRTLLCWTSYYTKGLIFEEKKILFVPKSVASFAKRYTPQRYYQHFVLNFLCQEHLRLGTPLVKRRIRKDGTEQVWVTKKSVQKEDPCSKNFLTTFTLKYPEIFKNFRSGEISKIKSPDNLCLCNTDLKSVIDALIDRLSEIEKGNSAASDYHNTIIGILELLFYPNLICPVKEDRIHDGRKRIDLTFENAANDGFFFNLHNVSKLPCPYIMVECKNYSEDPNNPELDQISSRFSPNRGQVGLLLCREISNEELLLKKCQDTFTDQRGLVIPLTDGDLISALNELRIGRSEIEGKLAIKKRKICFN